MFSPLSAALKPSTRMGQNSVAVRFEITDALTGAYLSNALITFSFLSLAGERTETILKRSDAGGNIAVTDAEFVASDELHGLLEAEGVFFFTVSATGYDTVTHIFWDTTTDPEVSPLFGNIVGVELMPKVTADPDPDPEPDPDPDPDPVADSGGNGTDTKSSGIKPEYIVGGISIAVIIVAIAVS